MRGSVMIALTMAPSIVAAVVTPPPGWFKAHMLPPAQVAESMRKVKDTPVSYTHLTLPTILLV